ncbi:MAG: PBP1A family penicillin-binding protein [Armatimonadetes bacterium]|nr:PBP1A family penicillin-binding protein [Armatimonadota bacterium]
MATTGTPQRPGVPNPAAPRRSNGGGPARPAPGPNGRRRRPRRSRIWHRIKLFFLTVTFLVLIVVIAGTWFLYTQIRQLPSSIDLNFAPNGRTLIYSADGVLLANLYSENREVVPIERIPKNLQDATIAFEDKRFYEHQGVDFKGIARSLVQNLKSGNMKAEGGSTITQQLARNMQVEGLTREKSIKRKLKEWIVANQIEKNYTKQDILWMYLNDVNYGSGAFGVEAAAKTYFGKDVSKLDLSQCALLAGLPNRPSEYSPYKNKDAAKAQRNRVLGQMLEQHYITVSQFAHAVAEKIKLAGARPPAQGSHIYAAPFFTDYVIEQLKEKYGEDTVMAGNMKVYTTLNMKMQEAAEKALQEHIHEVRGLGPTQGCLVALDPMTGEIKAMVGGMDYKKSQFNIAAQGLRQPGSSFKAIVYAAAIDSGAVMENTRVLDAPVTYRSGGKDYTPKDDSGYSYREVTLREAMAYSINVPAVKVITHIGPPLAIRYARLMGIDPNTPLDPVPSLALGSDGVTPLEMASVYGTIANGGNHAVPTALIRVEDGQGHVQEDFPPYVETQVLQKSTVTQLDDMLRAVVEEPRGTGHVVADVPEARGKTGTTQGHKDVWFIGYTPNLVCAVWAGHPIYRQLPDGSMRYEYGEAMSSGAWGMSVCAPVWRDFMLNAEPIFLKAQARERTLLHAKKAAHHAAPLPKPKPAGPSDRQSPDAAPDLTAPDNPPPSEGTVTVNVDNETGLLAPGGARHAHRERFARGAEPTVLAPQYDHSDDNGPAPPVDAAPETPVDAHPSPPGPSATRGGSVQQVTVRINPEDGLRATKWDPEVVERTYVKGQEPHRYSPLHRPPPGER